MEIINVEQGTPEWFQARAGIPTASNFKLVMAKGQGKTRKTYMLKLAGEILTGEVQEQFSNQHTERGNELEPEALELYELQTGNKVEKCGFIKAFGAGYSPDGMVGDEGLIEIKTKLSHLQIELLLKDTVPSEHVAQIQGGLWVSGREWCDFVSYCPGLPLFIARVRRDEKKIAEIEGSVEAFNLELNEIVKKIESY